MTTTNDHRRFAAGVTADTEKKTKVVVVGDTTRDMATELLAAREAEKRALDDGSIYKIVERILDEHSAWVARPDSDVTAKIAMAVGIAAHSIFSDALWLVTKERDCAREALAKAQAELLAVLAREATTTQRYDDRIAALEAKLAQEWEAEAIMREREACAEVARDFTDAKHAAHDMRSGVFPKQSFVGEAIAAAIRSRGESHAPP